MIKKGKGFNLTAGILDIIVSVFYVIVGFIMLCAGSLFDAVGDAVTSAGGSGVEAELVGVFSAIIGVVFLLYFVLYLTFGILTIKVANADANVYYAKTGRLLGFSITFTVFFALELIGVITAFDVSMLIGIILSLVILTFHWLGYGFANAGSKKFALSSAETTGGNNLQTAEPSVAEQLEKLSKLKESGAITEEEFNEMKSKILK